MCDEDDPALHRLHYTPDGQHPVCGADPDHAYGVDTTVLFAAVPIGLRCWGCHAWCADLSLHGLN